MKPLFTNLELSPMAKNGRNDWAQIIKTLQILAQSQFGYEARQFQAKSKNELVRMAVNGGNIVRPFDGPDQENVRMYVIDLNAKIFIEIPCQIPVIIYWIYLVMRLKE